MTRALAMLCLLGACAGGTAVQQRPPASVSAQAERATGEIEIPREPARAPLERTVVASGLRNPRGMLLLPDGALLVAEAGSGAPDDELSGRLLLLRDGNASGTYLDDGEPQVLLDRQPSKNILNIVRRDEVFGMAGMARGGDTVLAALAFFGGPSTIFRIDGQTVTPWGSTHGNVNDLSYDPRTQQWFAVASTTDEVVRLLPGGAAERVVKIPPLPSGQDAVPGYLAYDQLSGEILVSLFSGSPEGEEGGRGVELVPRAGGIIGVDPVAKSFHWVVRGLTVPTDLEIAPDGSIYVLEFCDAFLDPVATREALWQGPSHGGFRRFSGRLLRIDRKRGAVTVVAEGLDAPTNLALGASALYVAEGMGTPGREIPAPDGPRKLVGFIERIPLPEGAAAPK
jgi:hypothetical protein